MLTQSLQSCVEHIGTPYASFCLRLLADKMKKRAKKKFKTAMEKTTEWTLGQPLVFPTKLKSNEANRVGRELVDPAIGEPLKNPVRQSDGRR
jgi:hypothetical protein